MKKKNLKTLKLNKKSIAKMQKEQIKGGTFITESLAWCFSDTCITTVYNGPMKPTCGNC